MYLARTAAARSHLPWFCLPIITCVSFLPDCSRLFLTRWPHWESSELDLFDLLNLSCTQMAGIADREPMLSGPLVASFEGITLKMIFPE